VALYKEKGLANAGRTKITQILTRVNPLTCLAISSWIPTFCANCKCIYFSSPCAQFAYFAFMVVTVDSRDNISIATDSKLIVNESKQLLAEDSPGIPSLISSKLPALILLL
jgi:hypothetical protein